MYEIVADWQIFPEDCNPVKVREEYMAHGGAILTKADRMAAVLCSKLLRDKPLKALTVAVDRSQFYRGPVCGEILELKARLVSLGTSRITVLVEIIDENCKLVFKGEFSFCSFKENPNGDYFLAPHELKAESFVQ